MIFLVDLAGNISAVTARDLEGYSEVELGRLLAWQTWCFSLDQACSVARDRRARRRAK
ncbi:MAG TPA: hypothetical protein VFJ64_10810 [Solirubrobacterales bacterium]|nr:hypothetical protein [Solirubrobacterales bacterium]